MYHMSQYYIQSYISKANRNINSDLWQSWRSIMKAFMDDLFVMSCSTKGTQLLLNRCTQVLTWNGMSFRTEKFYYDYSFQGVGIYDDIRAKGSYCDVLRKNIVVF